MNTSLCRYYKKHANHKLLTLKQNAPRQCAKLAEARGYDEINLNVGCPSDRVQNGMFGACLMGNAPLVADCIKAMRDVVSIPVTVKTRIGIDDQDSYEFLCDFIETVSGKGECEMFIIHARKAWLSGLSPKENREIPPLDYPRASASFAHCARAWGSLPPSCRATGCSSSL